MNFPYESNPRTTMSAFCSSRSNEQYRGFSLIELITVVAILLIVSAIAVPYILSMVHMARLRGSTSDFSGLVQTARLRAVQDDRFYSAYVLGTQGFVDIYPQSNTGASGNAGTTIDPKDPQISISSEVTPIVAASAPSTTNLYGQFLPSGSTITVKDGSPGSGTPITFGPRGLPCTAQTATGGTVCDSAGGATAFWVFFQDTSTSAWQAVTISPAGRVRKWYYGGGGWNSI